MEEKTINLLIGERDPFARRQLERILPPPFNLIFVEDGTEILIKAKNIWPSLIILEALLPSADGFKVCQQLKSDPETKSTPVLFYTVLRAEARARQAGADGFLLKPQPPEKLLTSINNFLINPETKGESK